MYRLYNERGTLIYEMPAHRVGYIDWSDKKLWLESPIKKADTTIYGFSFDRLEVSNS